MFLVKRIKNLYPNRTYCWCVHKRALSTSLGRLNKANEENSNNGSVDTVDDLIDQFNDKLLFNSFINSKCVRRGYKENNIIMAKKLQYQEALTQTLRTVQPLPVSLKYFTEEGEKTDSETTACDDNANSLKTVAVEGQSSTVQFPYNIGNAPVNNEKKDNTSEHRRNLSVKTEIFERKKLLDNNLLNWMTSYENYEYDLVEGSDESHGLIKELEDWKINYGTPDPGCQISEHQCGGCGANLHCKDTSIPGYIPSEIFKNCFDPNGADLETILCQRCHFLKEYNIALQVRVLPHDYPKIIQAIPFNSALVVLMVDLTDFPCSIWPGIADIIGHRTPVVIVGNKVDLLPRDEQNFLTRIRNVLYENVKLCGFVDRNIKHVELVSAKTGFGVENLISALWRYKGNVYLIGCTNVGKSSLFNALLQSDFCKIQASDLIQRATTSAWPGTTLNLLKFPITKLSDHRLYMRNQRLKKLQQLEAVERQLQSDALRENNTAKYAALIGHIGQTFDKHTTKTNQSLDGFSVQGKNDMSGKSISGLNEKHPDFAFGKWCYDTPGVVHPDQILHMLTLEELMMVLPKEIIRPETFCVQPGMSLFIAGLARLDYVKGPCSVRLTVFRANQLPITVCKTEDASSFYDELLGTELLGVPVRKGDRLSKWPGLELAKTFTVAGKSFNQSSHDVVLSNAGWIAINCNQKNFEFKAWTPEKRGVYLRDCLLPKAVTLRGPRVRGSVSYKKHKFV